MYKLTNYYLLDYIIKIIPKYLLKNIIVKLNNNDILITSCNENLEFLINFLKYHWALQYKTLIGITASDYPEKEKRFSIFYFLLSYKLNNRLIVNVNISDRAYVNSICSIYKGANWYEREIWDMFGIYFVNHPDLRRILTDYGFEGFPFRKDFPQTGFLEIRYDDEKKYIVYEELEMTQEYRFFKYLNPWTNLK